VYFTQAPRHTHAYRMPYTPWKPLEQQQDYTAVTGGPSTVQIYYAAA
jgi:hypothetical protein